MKHVLLLTTGGTIASAPGSDGLAPEKSPPELLREVDHLSRHYRIHCKNILNLDSSNIQAEEWQLIARSVYEALPDYDGIVITHGTDTMAYTASMLTFMLQNLEKPVVLTGSQLPIGSPPLRRPRQPGHGLRRRPGGNPRRQRGLRPQNHQRLPGGQGPDHGLQRL